MTTTSTMKEAEILGLLKEALLDVAPHNSGVAEKLCLESTLGELGVDSIVALEMAGFVEERTGLRFPDDELARVSTIRGFADLIRRYQQLAA